MTWEGNRQQDSGGLRHNCSHLFLMCVRFVLPGREDNSLRLALAAHCSLCCQLQHLVTRTVLRDCSEIPNSNVCSTVVFDAALDAENVCLNAEADGSSCSCVFAASLKTVCWADCSRSPAQKSSETSRHGRESPCSRKCHKLACTAPCLIPVSGK